MESCAIVLRLVSSPDPSSVVGLSAAEFFLLKSQNRASSQVLVAVVLQPLEQLSLRASVR